jgi:hypothetical protein
MILLGSLGYTKVTFLNYIIELYYFKIIPFYCYYSIFVFVFNQDIILYPADLPRAILLVQTYILVKCSKLKVITLNIT